VLASSAQALATYRGLCSRPIGRADALSQLGGNHVRPAFALNATSKQRLRPLPCAYRSSLRNLLRGEALALPTTDPHRFWAAPTAGVTRAALRAGFGEPDQSQGRFTTQLRPGGGFTCRRKRHHTFRHKPLGPHYGHYTVKTAKTGANLVLLIHPDLAAWLSLRHRGIGAASVFPELANKGGTGKRGLSSISKAGLKHWHRRAWPIGE
jgi:hypothetical protein